MPLPLILASGSKIRAQLLEQAGIKATALPARIDEDAIKSALLAEDASPRDIADTLAEMKARKLSDKHPDARVLGCDQVLEHQKELLSKPKSVEDAHEQLLRLRGQTHSLLSAVVLYHECKPVWRHVGVVRLTMHDFSDDYLSSYLERNWPSISESVGGYKLEEEGVQLFNRIEGDYFTVLGLPLLEIISHLKLTGYLAS
ncbi:nucleoside triphosphate pyrophosphatase [Pelagovum sp. HNIBRBA483]|uniref:Maf family protein n=1 Tax=Pelagovum sp. HNIBRBA483 TaxID=3233341 RepID=UPI0034A3B9A8